MRKAAASGTVTQQILQNEDTMKIKVFSSNGSYSYVVVVGGEAVEFTDLNGDCCSTTAEWDEDRKCVVEHIAKTLKKFSSTQPLWFKMASEFYSTIKRSASWILIVFSVNWAL